MTAVLHICMMQNYLLGLQKALAFFRDCLVVFVEIVKVHYGITAIVYIDDFLVIEKTFEKCMFALQVLVKTLRQLGFCINWNKVEGPIFRSRDKNQL